MSRYITRNLNNSIVRRAVTCCRCSVNESTLRLSSALLHPIRKYSSEPLPSPGGDKKYPEHIVGVVDAISKMTLLEVSSLNELLKARLNIQDVPMMPMGGMVAPVVEEEVEEEPPEEVQTSFKIKLLAFDAAQKVKLIKEIKTILTDVNLVQAKKFVESAPVPIKDNLTKEEVDKMKEQLEAAGATIEIR